MKSLLSRILFSIACRFLRWSQILDADYGYDDEGDYYGHPRFDDEPVSDLPPMGHPENPRGVGTK